MTTCSIGGPGSTQGFVAEVVHVLDERLDALADLRPCGLLWPLLLAPCDLVAGQRFAQHGDQRPVAGEKDGMGRLVHRRAARGDVEADQRLPGAGHAGDEADDLAPCARASSTISSMRREVTRRLRAPASWRAIASTECCA